MDRPDNRGTSGEQTFTKIIQDRNPGGPATWTKRRASGKGPKQSELERAAEFAQAVKSDPAAAFTQYSTEEVSTLYQLADRINGPDGKPILSAGDFNAAYKSATGEAFGIAYDRFQHPYKYPKQGPAANLYPAGR